MTACRDIEPLLAERASGDLAPCDEARLEAHLGGCPQCRRELAAYAQALDMARMPVDERYGRALAGLDASTLAAWKGRRRRRASALALGVGLAAAAAAAILALSPALFHGGRRPAAASLAAASAWEPDVDTALAAADVLDTDGWYGASGYYDSSDDSTEDVVLAAFDEAAQQ